MTTVNLSPIFNGYQSFTNGGLPNAGGLLYTYQAGTSTPLATYTTNAGNVANANPIVMDPSGRPPQEIWLIQGSGYAFTLQDSLGVQIGTFDNVYGSDPSGGPDALRTQLADTTSAANGAGLVAFVYALAYSAGTLGRWLQDLSLSSGAGFIGWIQNLTGSVLRTVSDKLTDRVDAFDFMTFAQRADIKAGTLALDVTVPLQAFFDACKFKRGFLNKGRYRTTASIAIDYMASYWVSGEGFDITAASGTGIHSTANAPILSINNPGSTTYNPDITFEHFYLNGNNAGTSQKGIYARYTQINLKEIYIANCTDAFHLERCFSSVLQNCIAAQNYRNGLWLDKQCNEILVSHCFFNSNSRTAGYAGINCVGTSGNENLAVTFISCDTTGNGVASGTGYGSIIQYTHGVSFIGHYSEADKTNLLYCDNTTKNLKVDSSYYQDGAISIVATDGVTYTNNRHFFNSIATSVAIGGSPGSPIEIKGNTYGASVTTNYTSGAKQRIEQFDTAVPTTGTWAVGDIVWHRTPASAGFIGWVCTTAGTPGTWKTWGVIS